jgi:hypothetical protein
MEHVERPWCCKFLQWLRAEIWGRNESLGPRLGFRVFHRCYLAHSQGCQTTRSPGPGPDGPGRAAPDEPPAGPPARAAAVARRRWRAGRAQRWPGAPSTPDPAANACHHRRRNHFRVQPSSESDSESDSELASVCCSGRHLQVPL